MLSRRVRYDCCVLIDARPIHARKAAGELSPAAFMLWVLLHFETDLDAGRTVLSGRCGLPKSTFDRLLLELRRKAYAIVTPGEGRAPCSIRLSLVLDAAGRNAVRKYAGLTAARGSV